MSGVAGRVLLMLGRGRPSDQESDAGASAALAVDAAGRDRTLPRWLDPSIAAARSPHRSPTVAPDRRAPAPPRAPMVFVAPGDELGALHHVRYDGVPLLDRPDDVLGHTMQELDGGDQVDVLERAEIWARVRTPHDLIGWVPGMTLAAVSADPAEGPGLASDHDLQVAAEEPIALEALFAAVAARRLALRTPPPEAVPASPRRRTRKPKAEAPPPPKPRRRKPASAPRAEEP